MDSHRVDSLEQQVAALRAQVRRVEQALRSCGIVLPPEPAQFQRYGAGIPQPEPPNRPPESTVEPRVQSTVIAPSVSAESHPGPEVRFMQFEPPKDGRSLENRIGSQLFNRIGILAMLIGAAWFLKLAIDNHWIGPLGRVMIGLIAGGGFIAWSERFHKRGYEAFAYSLKAVGSGILYLSLWAAFSLYQIIPAALAFAAMILVTAFNGFLAWAQDSELLALYAIAGGLSTPLLISPGGNHEVTLFSYLLILDLAVFFLVVLRPWSRLLVVAFLGTAAFFGGWWLAHYSDEQSTATAFFLGCFFLVFAFAPLMVRVRVGDHGGSTAWDKLALIPIPIANAGLAFGGFCAIFDPYAAAWSGIWMAIGFAAFYLFMSQSKAGKGLPEYPTILSGIHRAIAVGFAIIAIPLKTQGRWLTIGWLVEGAALLWVASRAQSRLLRVLALACLVLGLLALVTINPAASDLPFLNQRFGSYCAGIAVFAFASWVARKPHQESGAVVSWATLSAFALLIVNVLILVAISLEIHSYWSSIRWHSEIGLTRGDSIYAQLSYSAWFMTYGAILLAVGFWRRSAFLRWQGLALLFISIVKVFMVDMSELSQGYRIISFLGLGGLLLAVSFVYQRDWLNLRVPRRPIS